MIEMISRERVEAALRHEEPDRVPLDIGGGNSTTLLVETYENLKNHVGLSTPMRIMNKAFRSADLDEAIMVRLGSDVRSVRTKPPKHWTPPPSEPDTFIDGFGIKWRRANYPGGYYWEVSDPPLGQATISDLKAHPWPDPNDPGYAIVSPNGGEHYYVGDTLRIEVTSAKPGNAFLELTLEAGYYRLTVPGLDHSINPQNEPVYSFVIPEFFHYGVDDSVSAVSGTCRVGIYDYGFAEQYHDQSDNWFHIHPK